MDSSAKENFHSDQVKKVLESRLVPSLNLKGKRDSMSPVEQVSYSSRMKKRSQFHRSLDFTLTKCAMETPKIIKAIHEVVPIASPSIPNRKVHNAILSQKQRKISKNIFLDQFPCKY